MLCKIADVDGWDDGRLRNVNGYLGMDFAVNAKLMQETTYAQNTIITCSFEWMVYDLHCVRTQYRSTVLLRTPPSCRYNVPL